MSKKKVQYNFQSQHPKFWNWIDIEQYFDYTWKNTKKKGDFKDTVKRKLDWNDKQFDVAMNIFKKNL